MAKQSSVEFEGVTFVPLGNKPRRAVKIYREGKWLPLFVLTPSGAVATTYDIFDRFFAPSPGVRLALVNALSQLGLLKRSEYDRLRRDIEAHDKAKQRRSMASGFENTADALGIKLTAGQKRKLAVVRKVAA